MAKVLVEGYRVTKNGGGLWTGVVGQDSGMARSQEGSSVNQPPPTPPKAVSAIKPAKPQK